MKKIKNNNIGSIPPCLGGLPSPADYRDIELSSLVPAVDLPSVFFNKVGHLPVDNQRKIGACVGFAGAKYKQQLDFNDTGKLFSLSPRFLYSLCKSLDKHDGEGTYPRLSMKILKDFGCSTTDTCPNYTELDHETYVYNRKGVEAITSAAIEEAKDFKISGYAKVDISIDGIKRAIYQSYGCSMLVRVGKEWYSDEKGNTWDSGRILPLKAPKEIISGHQIYVFGYEEIEGDLKIYFINSWGPDWASKGIGWFWWSEYNKYIVEAWTAIDIPTEILEMTKGLPNPKEFSFNFKRTLLMGMRGEDVKALQIALRILGDFHYPEVTGFYGSQTAKAVYAFQTKYNLAGYLELFFLGGKRVGAKTLKKLNSLFNK